MIEEIQTCVEPCLEEKRVPSGVIDVSRRVISRWGVAKKRFCGSVQRDRLNADRPAPLASG